MKLKKLFNLGNRIPNDIVCVFAGSFGYSTDDSNTPLVRSEYNC